MKKEDINRIIGITESFKLPERMMEILIDDSQRENVFDQFMAIGESLDHDGTVTAGKYMMFMPKDGQQYDCEYVYLMLEREVPKFLVRYATTLNVQADAFKHLKILWIDDDNERMQFTKLLTAFQKLIDKEIKLEDSINMFKKVMMDLMFV